MRRLLRNKEGKALVENIIALSILQAAGYIFPLITIPYLAKVIGLYRFGQIAFASAIMVYFQTFVDWGFSYTATKDVAQNRENKKKISEIYSNVFWSKLLLVVISLIILMICISFSDSLYKMYSLLIFSFLIIPGQVLFPDWLFQGLEKMRYITILNLISKLLFTLAIFIFIKKESDFIYQPLINALGYWFIGVLSIFLIKNKLNINLYRPSYIGIKQTILKSTDVFINQLMPNLYNSFSTLLVGFFSGAKSNGILDAGSKFVTIGQQLLAILTRAFFPFLSRRIDKHTLYANLSIVASIIISTFLIIFSSTIIQLFFPDDFKDAILVLRVLSTSIIFITLYNIYGTNYLIVQGYIREIRNLTIVISIIGFCISVPLVYKYGFMGASFTILITRGLLGISSLLKVKSIKRKI